MLPAPAQLRRIALFLGIPDPDPAPETAPRTLDEILREAAKAGIPIAEGRPDDPMLDLLDL